MSGIFIFIFLFYLGLTDGRRDDMTMADRWKQLNDLSHRNPIISIDNERFHSFIRGTPRNYSIIAMFTALDPRRECSICRAANEEFVITATSHRYSKHFPGNVFFATVDFDKAPEAFKAMKLDTAPMFMHFSAKVSHLKADKMDSQRAGISAGIISKWVESMTGVQIVVIRPPNYAGNFGLLILIALFGFFLYIRRNNLEFLYSKKTWSVLALFFSFTMASGQMWNHIRGPPFMQKTRDGGVAYIAGGSQSQYVIETYLVMVVSALTVTGMILMTEAAKSKSDVKVRKVMSIMGLGMYALFFSLMLSIFRSKSGGYPYSFLIS